MLHSEWTEGSHVRRFSQRRWVHLFLYIYVLLAFCSYLTFLLSNSPKIRLNYIFFSHTVYWIELKGMLLF